MEVLLAIIFFVLGFFVGKKSRKTFAFRTSEELKKMHQESRQALSRRTERRKARILSLAKKQGRITNNEVEDMFCISDRTANRYLNELEKEGKINQIGRSGRGVHYTPK